MSRARRPLVVVGGGMVGHRLVELLVERDGTSVWDVTVFCEERHLSYDRVGLSSVLAGTPPEQLSRFSAGLFEQPGLAVHVGDPVAAIERVDREVVSVAGRRVPYDALVLATGSTPFVPPVPGRDLPGCFVYRSLDDVMAVASAASSCRSVVVVGGGLLGLEAAGALHGLGLLTQVVEIAPRLMATQVDEGGARALRRWVEERGVVVHTAAQMEEIAAGADGSVRAVRLASGEQLEADMVVFSAGIRPRDQLARAAGLTVGERGGVVVDGSCRSSDPSILAIGECASVAGRVYGLVGPGYQMAAVAADQLLGGDASFAGADCSTLLKLVDVDVASFGDAMALTPRAEAITFDDPTAKVYRRVVVGGGGKTVLGGVLVGDVGGYASLSQMARGEHPEPVAVAPLVVPAALGGAEPADPLAGGEETTVCSCNNVTKGAIRRAIADGSLTNVGEVKGATRAGTGCGGCMPVVTELLRSSLAEAGMPMSNDLCEHFPHSRQELFDIVRGEKITSFSELLTRRGRGRGCEVCKPAVASILASLGNGYILDAEQGSLQDTNDHFLANIQRNGSYSVVPRVPGGEITPDQLVTIGQVAKDFGLYTKITGAQRLDLFGARIDQLPAIWERLIAVGLESGHAYGKALRTVKSCVGRTWCRYGVQDSTALAIRLELRYRVLRSPHKIKCSVSGCVHECAEAQGKDVGVIATESGWNLFVCGNGGARPRHASLLATDLDTEALVRYIDRFLMFYIRTADRLQRTAPWLESLDGGIDHLRGVVVEDTLGVAGDLEAAMASHVESYECEWKATLSDPDRLRRFRTFVNSDEPDQSVAFVTERGQPRPAQPQPGRMHERARHRRARGSESPTPQPVSISGDR